MTYLNDPVVGICDACGGRVALNEKKDALYCQGCGSRINKNGTALLIERNNRTTL